MKWISRWVVGVLVGTATGASAHEFVCEKKIDGAPGYEVSSYPTKVTYRMQVTNTHPTLPSRIDDVWAPMLPGYKFAHRLPYDVQVKRKVEDTYELQLPSYERCKELAKKDGRVDEYLDSTLTVGWDTGKTKCSARLKCKKPKPHGYEPPKQCKPTRTLGYFKNHVEALKKCLAASQSMALPFVADRSPEAAMGILWGSPSHYANGAPRNDLEKKRFLLGRQLLVAICNKALFYSEPKQPMLVEEALTALTQTDCGQLGRYAEQLDAFNNSETKCELPHGFYGGPAKPKEAQNMAKDPSVATGQTCAP